jgi:hypothetical protein
MLEFRNPIPVITPLGEGYAIYVTNGGTFENDVWAIVLEEDGRILHFCSDQLKMFKNGTFNIKNVSPSKPLQKKTNKNKRKYKE